MKIILIKKITTFFLFLLTLGMETYATTYNVGPTRTHTTPLALVNSVTIMDGDIIEIDASIYSGTGVVVTWHADNLIIRGIGGRPVLDATGVSISNGKAIFNIEGDNITIENIEFTGAAVPSLNGAGIRVNPAGLVTAFTVRDCYFHGNENGILTAGGAGDVLIEHCEFENNGLGDPGQTHNLYVNGVGSLTFRYNYSHNVKQQGHGLKSRAAENYIYYNRIMDESTGVSSRQIDLSNGGFSIVMGNLLMQGINAANNNILGYGLEGFSSGYSKELYVINNTFINKRGASVRFIQLNSSTLIADIRNNIFGGTSSNTTYVSGTPTTYSNNLEEPTISNLNFVDEPNYDYNLTAASTGAINLGAVVPPVSGYSLIPDEVYEHPTSSSSRFVDATIDIGAYEYQSVTLPAEFLFFDVVPFEEMAALKWATASEINAERFDVEHSENGFSFVKIGEVQAAGFSMTESLYEFLHEQASPHLNYYRLRQVDFDGRFAYSEIKAVDFKQPEKFNSLIIYPNPATDLLNVEFKLAGNYLLRVFDESGRLVLSDENVGTLDVSGLPTGVYALIVTSSYGNNYKKFFIGR